MKTISKVLAVSTVLLGAYAVQAHMTNNNHQHGDLYNKVQAMSAADRAGFEKMMHSNMGKMSSQEKQVFMEKMRTTQGVDEDHQETIHRKQEVRNDVNAMSTVERAEFVNMMRNKMSNASDAEKHEFFDYMGMNSQDRHSFFERLGVKHQKQEHKSHKDYDPSHNHNETEDK
jgi:hypothetical protein